jgi:dTDP-4-dehydrorhamnose 3,5-epimerase
MASTMPQPDLANVPRKDPPTVTAEGEVLAPLIDGVVVRYQRPIEDKRGEIVEVYRPSWGLHADPLVYVYQVRIRPGAIKGWVIHEHQDDRLFFVTGVLRWALYDDRPDSPTRGRLNDLVFSERAPALLVIPRGVYHAVRNIGTSDAIFVNMPTRAYEHESPDKLRLPLDNSLIPFSFDDGPGW